MTVARKLTGLLGLISLVALVFGCQKQDAPAADPVSAPVSVTPMDTVLRLHWLGKKTVFADTNAAGLMSIWSLPESARLESQTLDKLAAAPWMFLREETNSSSTNLLRPILDDLVTNESYVEIRRTTNSPNIADEMVLAVRMDSARAGLWETNLTTALESLTGIRPTNSAAIHGWTLVKHHAPNLIQLARVDDWTILGAGMDHNALFNETLTNISGHAGFLASTTNAWLQASGDLARVAMALGFEPGFRANLPQFTLAVTGDGENILTRGELTLPPSVSMQPTPWEIPTNLLDTNLTSFTAVRGAEPWLASCKLWTDFQGSPSLNQFFVWGVHGVPVATYFAAPSVDASNQVQRLSQSILNDGGPLFATNSYAGFERSKIFNGLSWRGLPYLQPFLRSIQTDGHEFIFAGGFPMERANEPFPSELIKELSNGTNIVYRDWEKTDERVNQWIYLGQFARVVSYKAQLPPDAASLSWLKAARPSLRSTVTEIKQMSPTELSFTRKSTVGFTAIELNLLADWLESPKFPIGLNSFLRTSSAAPSAGAPSR